jgi:hypothetical protein
MVEVYSWNDEGNDGIAAVVFRIGENSNVRFYECLL